MTTNTERVAEIISRAMLAPSFSAPEIRPLTAADALAKAGLLAPDLQIIRTREELAALDPDALVVTDLTFTHGWRIRHEKCAYRAADAHRLDLTWHGPLVVITPGDQVRAARQALEEA